MAVGPNQPQCNYLACEKLEMVAVIVSVAPQTYQQLGGRVGLGSVGRATLLPSLLKEIRDEEGTHNAMLHSIISNNFEHNHLMTY